MERASLKDMKDLTILVVDDEPDLGELVAFEFELVGAGVLNASNGKEAFEIVRRRQVDVIVSDIRMPGGDGVELLDNVRGQHPTSPSLVFMTGFADISIEDAYDKGAVAMFGKPFNRKELIDTVARSVLPHGERWGRELATNDKALRLEASFESLSEAAGSRHLRLGQGGLFIAVDQKLPVVGELVSFNISFKGDKLKALAGDGIVRWVRRQDDSPSRRGIGIEVRNLVGPEREQAVNFFASLQTIAFIPKG